MNPRPLDPQSSALAKLRYAPMSRALAPESVCIVEFWTVLSMRTWGKTRVHFADRLIAAVKRVGNPVMVGIDPRVEDLPPGFLDRFPARRAGVAEAFRAFGCGVIDAVEAVAPAVKFQAAFYEMYGPEGVAALHETARYAGEQRADRRHRRQAERHRLDRRGVRPRLPRQVARRRPA